MKPTAIKWFPIENAPEVFHFYRIYDDYKGLRILLKIDRVMLSALRLSFDYFFNYRITEKNNYFETNSILNITEGSVFQIENSSYTSWFHMVSLDIHKDAEIVHVLITTPTRCIDVLCIALPKIDWLP